MTIKQSYHLVCLPSFSLIVSVKVGVEVVVANSRPWEFDLPKVFLVVHLLLSPQFRWARLQRRLVEGFRLAETISVTCAYLVGMQMSVRCPACSIV